MRVSWLEDLDFELRCQCSLSLLPLIVMHITYVYMSSHTHTHVCTQQYVKHLLGLGDTQRLIFTIFMFFLYLLLAFWCEKHLFAFVFVFNFNCISPYTLLSFVLLSCALLYCVNINNDVDNFMAHKPKIFQLFFLIDLIFWFFFFVFFYSLGFLSLYSAKGNHGERKLLSAAQILS